MTSAEAQTLIPAFLDFVKTLKGDEKGQTANLMDDPCHSGAKRRRNMASNNLFASAPLPCCRLEGGSQRVFEGAVGGVGVAVASDGLPPGTSTMRKP